MWLKQPECFLQCVIWVKLCEVVYFVNLSLQDGVPLPAATVVLLSLLAPSASQEANTTLPLTYRARAAEGGEQVCSPDELHQRLQAITHNEVSNLLRNNPPVQVRCSDKNLGKLEHCPAASCSHIVSQSIPLATTGSWAPMEL